MQDLTLTIFMIDRRQPNKEAVVSQAVKEHLNPLIRV